MTAKSMSADKQDDEGGEAAKMAPAVVSEGVD